MTWEAYPSNIERLAVVSVMSFGIYSSAVTARLPSDLASTNRILHRTSRTMTVRMPRSTCCLIPQLRFFPMRILLTLSFVLLMAVDSLAIIDLSISLGAFFAFVQVPVPHLAMRIKPIQGFFNTAFKTSL